MKPRKEIYRRKLPHFQQPGQWYFVTCSLYGSMPKGAMDRCTLHLENAKDRLKIIQQQLERESDFLRESDFPSPTTSSWKLEVPKLEVPETRSSGDTKLQLTKAKEEYCIALRKYRFAYDKMLHKSSSKNFSLVSPNNLKVLEEALGFWEGKRLTSYTWCIMSNHFHWLLSVFNKDENGDPVYLQDILHSVKLFSARRINANENRSGQFWEHESFETTIRDERHFTNVWNYIINNPVAAGLVKNWKDWPATRTFEET